MVVGVDTCEKMTCAFILAMSLCSPSITPSCLSSGGPNNRPRLGRIPSGQNSKATHICVYVKEKNYSQAQFANLVRSSSCIQLIVRYNTFGISWKILKNKYLLSSDNCSIHRLLFGFGSSLLLRNSGVI